MAACKAESAHISSSGSVEQVCSARISFASSKCAGAAGIRYDQRFPRLQDRVREQLTGLRGGELSREESLEMAKVQDELSSLSSSFAMTSSSAPCARFCSLYSRTPHLHPHIHML